MAITVITTAPTAAQTTEVNKAMEAIENNEPYKAVLTDAEKNNYPTVAEQRYPFVQRAIRDMATLWMGKMAPDILDGFAKAQISLQVMDTYGQQMIRLEGLKELFKDARHIAGYQSLQWFQDFYDALLSLEKKGVAGADAAVAQLKGAFDQSSSTPTGAGPV